ncbi:hypothetical protein Q5752_006967 [Cryptotrichosporon argae]
MGAQQSSQAPQEQVISAPEPSTSVEFAPSLISRLASPASPAPSTTSTDDVVRQRLASEAAHIRQQEAEILSSISAALEKDNLDKEQGAAAGLSSDRLGRDIDDVREKVERLRREREGKESARIREAKDEVTRCYLSHPDRPLDCWKEVEAFKAEVSALEQAFVKSMQ